MKFSERTKCNPFVSYDNVGRVVYYNDWISEYISENISEDTMRCIEELKEEEALDLKQTA